MGGQTGHVGTMTQKWPHSTTGRPGVLCSKIYAPLVGQKLPESSLRITLRFILVPAQNIVVHLSTNIILLLTFHALFVTDKNEEYEIR